MGTDWSRGGQEKAAIGSKEVCAEGPEEVGKWLAQGRQRETGKMAWVEHESRVTH